MLGKKVNWPAAVNMRKVRLNLGVSAAINHIPGAIGYLDYGFASLAKLDLASLENKNRKFIEPGLEGGQAALANAEIPADMVVWLSDPAGDKSYPITTYTWMMFYKKYDDPKKAEGLRKMILYSLDEGQKISDRFGYIPLPANVVERVRTAAANIR